MLLGSQVSGVADVVPDIQLHKRNAHRSAARLAFFTRCRYIRQVIGGPFHRTGGKGREAFAALPPALLIQHCQRKCKARGVTSP